MSHAGEFRLCSGCGQWAIWTPQRRTGPIFCCEACARGLRCATRPSKEMGIWGEGRGSALMLGKWIVRWWNEAHDAARRRFGKNGEMGLE